MVGAIYAIFSHYAHASAAVDGELSIDSLTFTKMCKETPGLTDPSIMKFDGPLRMITKQDVDAIFSECVPYSLKGLDFESFLSAALKLSQTIYIAEEPNTALSLFLCRNLFGLFDQTPIADETNTLALIKHSLILRES